MLQMPPPIIHFCLPLIAQEDTNGKRPQQVREWVGWTGQALSHEVWDKVGVVQLSRRSRGSSARLGKSIPPQIC